MIWNRFAIAAWMLCAAAVGWTNSAVALAPDTKLWVSLRGGAHFFIDNDQSDLEALASELSDPRDDVDIVFESKVWEMPFGARLGFAPTPQMSVFFLYERVPYLLDAPLAEPDLTDFSNPRSDSIRFEAPANYFGGGVDFALFSGYSRGMRMGFAGGVIDMEGDDEDLVGRRNFLVDGKGYFFDAYASLEWEFNGEISFYPFLQYRFAKVPDPYATDLRLPIDDYSEDFEIDYSGLELGIEVRIRAFPFTLDGQ